MSGDSHADGLGSIMDITDTNGSIVQSYLYDAFENGPGPINCHSCEFVFIESSLIKTNTHESNNFVERMQ